MDEEIEAVKRPHVETGTTPNKPTPKRRSLKGKHTGETAKKGLTFTSETNDSPKTPSHRCGLRGKSTPLYRLTSPKQSPKIKWQNKEDIALIQFVALHKDMQITDAEWPAIKSKSQYWSDAAAFIAEHAGTTYTREAGPVRQRVVVEYQQRRKFKTVAEAEKAFGITCDTYLGPSTDEMSDSKIKAPDQMLSNLVHLSQHQLMEIISNASKLIHDKAGLVAVLDVDVETLTLGLFKQASLVSQGTILDAIYLELAKANGIRTNPKHFGTLSVNAMKTLQEHNKPNLVYKWCQCLYGDDRPLKLDRMPFGMIQYCIEFFSCTHIAQITEPPDYRIWLDTMEAEFGGGKFKRLFRGPMWSGCDKEEIGDPKKAKSNIPCRSTQAQLSTIAKSDFTNKPEIQMEAIKALKLSNPKGNFWIKADGTDVKEALQESLTKVWNGDVDKRDGELDKLRELYNNRLCASHSISNRSLNGRRLKDAVAVMNADINNDIQFLYDGLVKAVQLFRKKFDAPNTPTEKLKALNWEIVEFHTLLEQATCFRELTEEMVSCLDPLSSMSKDLAESLDSTKEMMSSKDVVQLWKKEDYDQYLKNLFKKKRECASHILVFMVSDECRHKKPYAIPMQFIPYHTIRDQEVRDLTKHIKVEMTKAGLSVVGTCTDGEFEQLRRRGETRPLHVWQIAHDSRDSVSKMSKNTLLQMLELQGVDPNGLAVVTRPNPAIPSDIILRLHHLRFQEGMALDDAITYLRGKLVPDGYTPYPFRRDTSESLLDKLRSLVATYKFRSDIDYWKGKGVQFNLYCYVPEIDPDTGLVHHERADHNHVLKRIGKHTRDGGNAQLTYERFDEAMRDPSTGLTYAALVGQRQQSVPDAEKLLSFHVAEYFTQKGYLPEAEYVEVIAQWHEASDGRGISQLQRCRQNYRMLNFILDEWLPWHKENYDFSTLDINRPISGIKGFSRETVIEITTNIESQEYRRRSISQIGHAEHPRAGSTDDLECFFAMCHSWLGPVFTLREFKDKWRKIVREFTKRMDPELPFYYHTLQERFSLDLLPSFDQPPDGDHPDQRKNPYRLKRLKRCTREDNTIFAAGRSFLPAKNRPTVRQRFHRHDVGLPPVLGNNVQ